MKNESLISIMVEAGIALYGGGDPHRALRLHKNRLSPASSLRRGVETILKEDRRYIERAVGVLARGL